jgi:putative transposase
VGLSRSGLYDQPVGPSAEDVELMRWLDASYTATPFDGIRRMTAWWRGLGSAVHHTHGGRLLPTMGLEALSAKPRLSPLAEGHTIYPYLLREVTVSRNTQVWRTDIPSIRLPVSFVSLVAVMDWFGRSGLSWAVVITMDVRLCLEALEQALRGGRPEIFNTDQGAQFTSQECIARL